MRRLNRKQFLKVIKGEDLEFRINSFSFKLHESVVISDVHLPYDLTLESCKLENLTFINCRFSGDLEIQSSKLESLKFESCQLHSLAINKSDISSIIVKNSTELNSLRIGDNDINKIEITDNPIYELIHLGCGNNIKECNLWNNGDPSKNSFSTKLFLCPERFDSIQVDQMTIDLLHIGTFGEYAHFSLANLKVDIILIEGCSPDLSKVSFKNIEPIDKSGGAIHLVNTAYDQDLFGDAFKAYKDTKIHHDLAEILSLLA
ncbi:hypothetical protein [Roseivirga sp.]|uniref:hypothetical protein n=1 Tax=Roseivirga sp. TaxID=1964215 RepID=UPI003B8CFFC8